MGQTRSSVAALPPHYVASLAPLLSSYVRSYLKEDKGLSLIFLESQDRYVGGCYLTFLSYEIHEKEGFQTQKGERLDSSEVVEGIALFYDFKDSEYQPEDRL